MASLTDRFKANFWFVEHERDHPTLQKVCESGSIIHKKVLVRNIRKKMAFDEWEPLFNNETKVSFRE